MVWFIIGVSNPNHFHSFSSKYEILVYLLLILVNL